METGNSLTCPWMCANHIPFPKKISFVLSSVSLVSCHFLSSLVSFLLSLLLFVVSSFVPFFRHSGFAKVTIFSFLISLCYVRVFLFLFSLYFSFVRFVLVDPARVISP
ncbi:MAG: hypothetical protein BYD32DRAFT_196762 [Podila humilis]|nr:MAG: hypothetical protein BYD32DRAFT_196762 [Podila humilis]